MKLTAMTQVTIDGAMQGNGAASDDRSGRESRAAFDKAIDLAGNTAETAYLTRRRDQLR